MYHKVDELPAGARHPGNYVLPAEFEAQLAALERWGYTSVGFDDWLNFRARRASLPPRPVIITFDDGYLSTYSTAWPLLRRSKFSATVFLVSGRISGTNSWDADEMQEPLLGPSEIREMQNGGISFGSHTVTHAALTKIPRQEAAVELGESRRALETLLDKPVTTLCYPYAKQNPEVRALARDAGYRAAVIGRGGVNRVWTDDFALRRIKIDTRTTISSLRRSLRLAPLRF